MSADPVWQIPGVGPVHYHPGSERELSLMVREVFELEEYYRAGVELAPGACVVDAGANIGLFSLDAHRRTGGALSLLAFEPAPRSFRLLERNLGAHGALASGACALFPLALGALDGPASARLSFFPRLPGNSTLDGAAKRAELAALGQRAVERARAQPGGAVLAHLAAAEVATWTEAEEVEVPLAPLGPLLLARGIGRVDLLKIDVEGAELAVLEGLDAQTWPLVQQVVVEASGAKRAAQVEERLRRAGFPRVLAERGPSALELELPNWLVVGRR